MQAIATLRNRARLLPFLMLGAVLGCGANSPKTHSVAGKIELQRGDVSLLAGSTLEVSLASDPTIRGFGTIQPDGSFRLQSLQAGELRTGVQEGHYIARIIPNDEDSESRKRAMKAVSPKYLQFNRSGLTVDVPAENDITLTLSAR